jgi:hypothetical protein
MAEDTEDPDRSADRLEAALERIARLAAAPLPPAAEGATAQEPLPPGTDMAAVVSGLDALIERLRTALAARPD